MAQQLLMPAANAAVVRTAATPELDSLQSLVAHLGRDSFFNSFLLQCSALCRADQISVFAIRDGSIHCLAAHRPRGDMNVVELCRKYTRHYVERDAFLESVLRERAPFTAAVVSIEDIGDSAYRRLLFEDAGLEGKIAAVSRGTRTHFYLNVYYRDLGSDAFLQGMEQFGRLGPLLLELFRKHCLMTGSGWSAPAGRTQVEDYLREHLACLSLRERQVCARILCGYSTEAIAAELKVSIPTVKTFRQRAYAKLSISSQSELFARCAGLLAQ